MQTQNNEILLIHIAKLKNLSIVAKILLLVSLNIPKLIVFSPIWIIPREVLKKVNTACQRIFYIPNFIKYGLVYRTGENLQLECRNQEIETQVT